MVDPGWVKQRDWTHEDALINLQIFDAAEIHDVIQSGRPAYLSGGRGLFAGIHPKRLRAGGTAVNRHRAETGWQRGPKAYGQRVFQARPVGRQVS